MTTKRRTSKYDWDAIEKYFVYGEEVKGPDGATSRTRPSVSDVARKFGASLSVISDRAKEKDSNGNDWWKRRDDLLTAIKTETDTRLAVEIADKEVAFRSSTLNAAQLTVQHCTSQLLRGLRKTADNKLVSMLKADDLTKLAGALKRAQETGMVAMDRPADGPAAGEGEGSDWTLMRKVRAGVVPVPKGHGPDGGENGNG